ncbi:hypothetical protein V865_004328 [Kwoniella europaea PYCC6329]|uniref:Major facilitator superfamily (MFS) profile domain-containing protein n=1 Tax=Kwoniella europaea PYCC6329 TaxID=1423913 RepID=A0AAX4KID6_9TREE
MPSTQSDNAPIDATEDQTPNEDQQSQTVDRPMTIVSSSATLCGLADNDNDGDTSADKAKSTDVEVPSSIPEHPTSNSPHPQQPITGRNRSSTLTHTHRHDTESGRHRSHTVTHTPNRKFSLRRSNTIDDGPAPPIPAPGDVIAVLDPASVGGGGPLKRIETARSERYEREAKERAERQAMGLPPDGTGILKKFRSFSTGSARSRRRPTFSTPLPPHPIDDEEHEHEHEHDEDNHHTRYKLRKHKPTLSPTHSRKSSVVVTPGARSDEGKEGYFGASSSSDHTPSGDEKDLERQSRFKEYEEHVYPDGGYGWVVLVGCVILAGCTMGWNMNYGVFQEYYSTNIFPGQSTAVLILPGCFNGFFMSSSAFLSGRMGDRYGFKRVLYSSAGLFWLGLFLASWSTKLWQLALTQGVISGFGQGLAMPLFMSLPSQWFYKKRGLASGIAIGGAGLGGGTITLVARQLLTTVGYKKTLLILSFVELCFMLLAIQFLRTRPTSPEARSGKTAPWVDKDVVKTGAFWSIMIGTVVGTVGYGMPFSFLAQYVRVNYTITDPILLALPTTLLAYMVCVGRALVGFVADRIGPLNTYILVFFLSGVIQLCLWLTAKSFGATLAFAVMFGLIAPGFSGILPQIIVQLFGPANLATNVGLILISQAPGNFINGPIGGGLYDATGRTTFKYTIIFGGAMQILGGVLACYARYKTSRKFIVKV